MRSTPDPAPRPFVLRVDEDELASLARRLREARLPEEATTGPDSWAQGVPLATVEAT